MAVFFIVGKKDDHFYDEVYEMIADKISWHISVDELREANPIKVGLRDEEFRKLVRWKSNIKRELKGKKKDQILKKIDEYYREEFGVTTHYLDKSPELVVYEIR